MVWISRELQTKAADGHGRFQVDSILHQILIQTHLTAADMIQSIILTPHINNRRIFWQQIVCDQVLKKIGFYNVPLQLSGK